MWSEESNKKIKQAFENHMPEYDESAWLKMEALLNKHLPTKKDLQLGFIYVFFLCLIISGPLLLNKEWSKNIPEDRLLKNGKHVITNGKNINIDSKDVFGSKNLKAFDDYVYLNHANRKKKTIWFKTDRNNIANLTSAQHPQRRLAASIDENKIGEIENVNSSPLNVDSKKQTNAGSQNQNEKLITEPTIAQQQLITDALTVTVDTGKTIEPTAPGKISQKKIKNNNFFSRLSFSVSAGPDVSAVGLSDPGKVKPSYGAGISYNISKQFSIKTGFYAADKIYSSDKDDYSPPYGYWTYNIDLKRVDADCKVNEIPLIVYYSFKEKNQHHWFAALGSSTYLMKEETYHYLYKTQTGSMLYRGWTLKDKNKHYFSVFTVSGGYAYQLNKTFSLMAEPYLKIPTRGLGFGNIKLKSTGIMFTISATPF